VIAQGRRLPSLVVGTVVGTVATALFIGSATGAESREAIPLLAEPPSLSIERDMPKPVQARLARAQRKALALLKSAAKQHPSRAAGCATDDFGQLGPPPPDVTPVVFGQHVEVVIRFKRLPRSIACRPWAILVSIKGRLTNARGDSLPLTELFQLRGPIGRVVISLPYNARAPYQLIVSAGTVFGRRSKLVRQNLSCPPKDCLQGVSWKPNGEQVPQPILQIRGINRLDLETSFRDALTAARPAPFMMRDAGCTGLTTCQATFADPLFPDSPYRVRYQIEGEQVAGCWAARTKRILDPLPYEDTYKGPTPAGCASWLR
jgi:hypothetical protein